MILFRLSGDRSTPQTKMGKSIPADKRMIVGSTFQASFL